MQHNYHYTGRDNIEKYTRGSISQGANSGWKTHFYSSKCKESSCCYSQHDLYFPSKKISTWWPHLEDKSSEFVLIASILIYRVIKIRLTLTYVVCWPLLFIVKLLLYIYYMDRNFL
jgi:hypothetical protein